jgi:hypothetical protein
LISYCISCFAIPPCALQVSRALTTNNSRFWSAMMILFREYTAAALLSGNLGKNVAIDDEFVTLFLQGQGENDKGALTTVFKFSLGAATPTVPKVPPRTCLNPPPPPPTHTHQTPSPHTQTQCASDNQYSLMLILVVLFLFNTICTRTLQQHFEVSVFILC